MPADDRPTNGFVRWRDLDEREQRIRTDHGEEMRRSEASVKERLDKAHIYHTDLASMQTDAIAKLAERTRAVEDVIDQQRGARALIYFLIGSNLVAAFVGIAALVTFASA